MKILFVQLPLLDHGSQYVDGNIPYASATIASYIKQRFGSDHQVSYLPVELANFASDSIIFRYISNLNPDVVSFSNYLWNVERHLYLAQLLKAQNHQIKIVFGGPEIHYQSFVLKEKREFVDYFVLGEGEWFFSQLLDGTLPPADTQYADNKLIVQPSDELLSADDLVEPFTSKMLNPQPDGSIFLEMTRGCPYKCSYCFYSKNSVGVRECSKDLLKKAVSFQEFFNLREIYILSPTFDHSKDFKLILTELADINKGISLHTELRTENIDKETAALLYGAGFRSLEVGVQTFTIEALKNSNRGLQVKKVLAGILNLRDAGIDLKIGVIPGLPGDTAQEFLDTIDILLEHDLQESIEFYPLMILPGTAIRDQAIRENFSFQSKPPYFLIDNGTFTHQDIIMVKSYIEDKTGFDATVESLPNFISSTGAPYTHGVVIHKGDEQSSWHGEQYKEYIDSSVFSFFVHMDSTHLQFDGLKELFWPVMSDHQLFNLVFYCEDLLDETIIEEFLKITESDSFYERMNLYNNWKEGCRIYCFQVMDNVSAFHNAFSSYELINPILKIIPENVEQAMSYVGDEVPNVLISTKIAAAVMTNLAEVYQDFPESVAFENEDDYREFMQILGVELNEYAISFSIK